MESTSYLMHLTKSDIKMIINYNLYKYNSTPEEVNVKVINDIIFDEKKKIVSLFKDFLLIDEVSDFLKRYYLIEESELRIPRICDYYLDFLSPAPNYSVFSQRRLLIKNLRRKVKVMELLNHPQLSHSREKYSTLISNGLLTASEDSSINLTGHFESEFEKCKLFDFNKWQNTQVSKSVSEIELHSDHFRSSDSIISLLKNNFATEIHSCPNSKLSPSKKDNYKNFIHKPQTPPSEENKINFNSYIQENEAPEAIDPNQIYELIEDNNGDLSVSKVLNLSQLESTLCRNQSKKIQKRKEEGSDLIKRVTVNKKAFIKKKKKDDLNKEILPFKILSPRNKNINTINSPKNAICLNLGGIPKTKTNFKKQFLAKDVPFFKRSIVIPGSSNLNNKNLDIQTSGSIKENTVTQNSLKYNSFQNSSVHVKSDIFKKIKKESSSNQNLKQFFKKSSDVVNLASPSVLNTTNSNTKTSTIGKESPIYNISLNFNFNLNVSESVMMQKKNLMGQTPLSPKVGDNIILAKKTPSFINTCRSYLKTSINLNDVRKVLSPTALNNKEAGFTKKKSLNIIEPHTTVNVPTGKKKLEKKTYSAAYLNKKSNPIPRIDNFYNNATNTARAVMNSLTIKESKINNNSKPNLKESPAKKAGSKAGSNLNTPKNTGTLNFNSNSSKNIKNKIPPDNSVSNSKSNREGNKNGNIITRMIKYVGATGSSNLGKSNISKKIK